MSTTTRLRYPSDLTDLQWDNIEHLLPRCPVTRPRRTVGRTELATTTPGSPTRA